MPRLSIIIPFFRNTPSEAFEETLASVLAHRPDDAEILIADVGGYADPWDVGGEGVKFFSFPAHCSPLAALNDTIRSATAPVVHILYAGADVSENWTRTPLEYFRDLRVGTVVPTVFDRRKNKRIFAMGVAFSRGGSLRTVRRSQLPHIQQTMVAPHVSAVFFRKTALLQIGLLQTSFIPQLSYLDAAFLLNECRWTCVVDSRCRIFVRPNMLPTTSPFAWAKQLERLYFRWMGRQTSFQAVGSHLAAVAADFWRHFPRLRAFQALLGRFTGLVSLNEHQVLAKQLQEVAGRLSLDESSAVSREAA